MVGSVSPEYKWPSGVSYQRVSDMKYRRDSTWSDNISTLLQADITTTIRVSPISRLVLGWCLRTNPLNVQTIYIISYHILVVSSSKVAPFVAYVQLGWVVSRGLQLFLSLTRSRVGALLVLPRMGWSWGLLSAMYTLSRRTVFFYIFRFFIGPRTARLVCLYV